MDASPPTEGMAPERSIVPTVERRRDGLSGWAIGLGVAVLGLVLFGVLDARRRQPEIASTAVRPIDQVDLPDKTPVLDIPPEPAPSPIVTATPPPPVARSTPSPVPPRSAPPPAPVFDRPTAIVALPTSVTRPTAGAGATGAAIVFDGSTAKSGASDAAGGAASGTATPGVVGSTERVRAGMFANRSTTVLQGTLIPAVLETAFDSTRPGFARALVSRNVVGFDGARVLIPRGSRLIGEYRSDAALGQNRALVIWSRLIRPDGAVIQLASPAADTLGRGGVKADVNTHFLARFSGAILQSALDVGVNLASSRLDNGTVVVLPGTLSGGTSQIVRPNAIPPTLSIKAGVSISVFVARDLDFTDVEKKP